MKRGNGINKESKKAKARRSPAAAWRATFHERSGGVCEWCESQRSTMVHHLYERASYGKLILHPANGLACCAQCHLDIHKDLIYARSCWAFVNPEFAALRAETGEIKVRASDALPVKPPAFNREGRES